MIIQDKIFAGMHLQQEKILKIFLDLGKLLISGPKEQILINKKSR